MMSLEDHCLWLDMRPAHFYELSSNQKNGSLSGEQARITWFRLRNDKLFPAGVKKRDYWSGFLAATTEFEKTDSYERFSYGQSILKNMAKAGFVTVAGRIGQLDDGTGGKRLGLKISATFRASAPVSHSEEAPHWACFQVGNFGNFEVVAIQDEQSNNTLRFFGQNGVSTDLYRVVLTRHTYNYSPDYRRYLSAAKEKPVENNRQGVGLLRYDPIEEIWSLVRFQTQNRSESLDLDIVNGWLQRL